MRLLCVICLCAVVIFPLRVFAKSDIWHAHIVVIDKLTAQHTHFNVPLRQSVTYEKIMIAAEKCWIQRSDIMPEHAALVTITHRTDQAKPLLYQGWLFKEKANITNLQHPAYDVQLLGCERTEQDSES